jgi:uncharacterized membrane protein
MESRPRLNIQLTRLDKTLEVIGLALLVLIWVLTITLFSKLPDQVPIHYNVLGKPDRLADKKFSFLIPLIGTVLYVGLTWLNKYPHIYNYAPRITDENARRLYTDATRLIRILKLGVVIIFSGIMFFTWKGAFTGQSGLGPWFLPAAIAMMIIPNIIYLTRTLGNKTKSETKIYR